MNRLVRKIVIETSYLTGKCYIPPEFVSLIITFRCNFQCKSCSIWKKKETDEMSKEQWLNIADDLKGTIRKESFVEINGGEPLLRKDVVIDLVKRLKKHFKNVALNSNGSLIDEKTTKELEETGLDIIKISFYSLDEKIHNYLRGDDQSHGKALAAIKAVLKSKIKLEVGILITAKNIREIPRLIQHLQTIGNVSIILQPLDESIESAESKNLDKNFLLADLWPEKEDVLRFFSWILKNPGKIKNSQRGIKAMEKYYLNPEKILSYRCFAGQRNLVIYPDGSASFCFKGKRIGNLKNDRVNNLLRMSQAVRERKNIKKCQKYCRIVGCNFSRGFVEYIKDLARS